MGFPAWCEPKPLESLLERLAQEMSYTEKNWLETLPTPLRLHQPNLIRSQATFRSLAELTYLDVETLFLMTLHRFASVFYLPETWPRWPAEFDDFPAPLWEAGGLERYVHGRGHGKACPLCWREQPALLLPWSLRPITTCLKHQIMLVDHCPAGQHDLVIDQRRGSCATCDYALNQLPVTALPAEEESQELTRLLWTAVGCGEESFPPPTLALPAHSPLRHMHPAACLPFLWQMGPPAGDTRLGQSALCGGRTGAREADAAYYPDHARTGQRRNGPYDPDRRAALGPTVGMGSWNGWSNRRNP